VSNLSQKVCPLCQQGVLLVTLTFNIEGFTEDGLRRPRQPEA
jgi:hypothetical protein